MQGKALVGGRVTGEITVAIPNPRTQNPHKDENGGTRQIAIPEPRKENPPQAENGGTRQVAIPRTHATARSRHA
jgi:hypothetical protein